MVQESIERNKFDDCIDMRVTALKEYYTRKATRMSDKSRPSADMHESHDVGSTLDMELPDEKIHVLKIHTNGNEDGILRGARRLISGPGIDTFLINTHSTKVAGRVMEFLSSLDNDLGIRYKCTVREVEVDQHFSFDQTEKTRRLLGDASFNMVCRRRDLIS